MVDRSIVCFAVEVTVFGRIEFLTLISKFVKIIFAMDSKSLRNFDRLKVEQTVSKCLPSPLPKYVKPITHSKYLSNAGLINSLSLSRF